MIELLLHLVAASLTLSLLIRGGRPARSRGHVLLLTGNLALAIAVIASHAYQTFWSFLALGLFVGTSLVPGVLQRLLDRAAARGNYLAAARWARWRGLIIPGSKPFAAPRSSVADLSAGRPAPNGDSDIASVLREPQDPIAAARGLLSTLRSRYEAVAAEPPSDERQAELATLESQLAVVAAALSALEAAPSPASSSRWSRLRESFTRHPVTLALVAVNVAIWLAVELLGGSTDRLTLVRAGANFKVAVRSGEWQRLITSMFLHIGPLHLLFNVYALWSLGRFFEPLFGRARFWLVYLLSGVAGAVASAWYGPGALSAGASGAIFGLMGAGIVALRAGPTVQSGSSVRIGSWVAESADALSSLAAWRRRIVTNLVLVAAVNLAIGFRLGMVDNTAHLGGLVGGAGAALLLLSLRRLQRGAARLGVGVVTALSLLGLIATAASLALAWSTPLSKTFERLPTRRADFGGPMLTIPDDWVRPPGDGTPPSGGSSSGGSSSRQESTTAWTDPLLDILPTLRVEQVDAANAPPLDADAVRRWVEAERQALAHLANVADVQRDPSVETAPPIALGWHQARLRFRLKPDSEGASDADDGYVEDIFLTRRGARDLIVVARLPLRAAAAYRGLLARALSMVDG